MAEMSIGLIFTRFVYLHRTFMAAAAAAAAIRLAEERRNQPSHVTPYAYDHSQAVGRRPKLRRQVSSALSFIHERQERGHNTPVICIVYTPGWYIVHRVVALVLLPMCVRLAVHVIPALRRVFAWCFPCATVPPAGSYQR